MCRRACRLPRSHIYNKVWRGGRVCRRACRLPRSHIYNKVWQGERVCRRVTGCTRRVLVSCGMAVSVFLRCGRSLFVLGVDFRGAKLMFFFVKTHFLCFFHRICVGFCVRRRFCLAKTARNRGGDVCGWECGCARRGAAAFAVGVAVVRGEGRRRLRLGVRLCAERVGGVCGWECGCARRGAAAFAVGSAVVCGEGRRRLRLGVRLCAERDGGVCGWECGCARRGAEMFACSGGLCSEWFPVFACLLVFHHGEV